MAYYYCVAVKIRANNKYYKGWTYLLFNIIIPKTKFATNDPYNQTININFDKSTIIWSVLGVIPGKGNGVIAVLMIIIMNLKW